MNFELESLVENGVLEVKDEQLWLNCHLKSQN